MKTIQLIKSTIQLPDCWEDLQQPLRGMAVEWFYEMVKGQITAFEWQMRVFVAYTGYEPGKRTSSVDEEFDIVTFNVVRLCEQLNFAFTQQYNAQTDRYETHLNYEINYPPVSVRCVRDTVIQPPFFLYNDIVQTNLTAGQFATALALLQMSNDAPTPQKKRAAQVQLIHTLWCIDIDEMIEPMTDAQFFMVELWMTGVAQFFENHYIYSVLYERDGNNDKPDNYITLGMQETIFELEKQGYSNVKDMNVLDFFDAQVKMLKDAVQQAFADGLKIEEVVKQTGIPLKNIMRLK